MNNLQKLFTSILDLAGGVDGGVAFATLYHSTLPQIQKLADSGDKSALEFVNCLAKVSKMCDLHLKNTRTKEQETNNEK